MVIFDDVLLNKRESIQRCMKRVKEDYAGDPERLENFTVQDAIVLNVQRACELSIDIANYLVAKYDLGIPKESRESFRILCDNSVISSEVSDLLQRMVGFRNKAIHEYTEIRVELLQSIIEDHLSDFERFIHEVLEYEKSRASE